MTLQPNRHTNDLLSRPTILLVEDEPFVREATASILERAGFEVLIPVEGAEFEACLRLRIARPHSP